MALILKDRVKETSTTSGTGTLTLAGAVTGYQSFSSAIGNGNTTYYAVYQDGGADWEVGIGTVGSGTLSRTTVLASSNSGSLVNFSGAQLTVWCDYPAGKAVYTDANGNITNLAGYIGTPNYINFNTAYATTLGAGQLGWDGNNTLGLGMAGGNVVQKIGEDFFIYVKASSAITKGQVVMFTGAVGSSGVVTGAPATGVTNGQYIMGVAAESIALNGFGLIQTFGSLRNIDTSAYSDGDVLYYNNAVTGGFTTTYPTSGPIVTIAAVVNGGSSGGGVIQIRTSVTQRITAGTGISVSQNGTGATVTNTAPDQTVTLTAGTGISTSGTYPNFTITNTSPSSGGTVTNVSGTTPIAVANGTTTPTVSIQVANATQSGYLTSTDWNTFNNKQPAGTYVTSVGATAPITSTGGTTPTLAIPVASASANGYLSSTDWSTFNGKAPATSGTSILYGNGSGGFNNVTIGSNLTFSGGTLSASGATPAGSNTQVQYNNSGAFGASSSFTFNSSTGDLTTPQVVASNGLIENSATVNTSYTVASGNNAMSVGPITIASGKAVTVSSGQRWVVL